MVHYITSPENLALVKELCEIKDIGLEYTTNIKDIKLFANTELSKLAHVKYFVIDISCLQNSEKEIYDIICGMEYMTHARIIVIAIGRTANDNFIQALVNKGVCNIVLSKQKETAQIEMSKCLSSDGRGKQDILPDNTSPFAPEQASEINQPVKVNTPEYKKKELPILDKAMITIGICGVEPHVGATHHAMAITSYLGSLKYKACYLESNIHGDIQKMMDTYKDSHKMVHEDGGIDWGGVMLYHDYSFLDILNLGYQFYVYDFGTCRDITSQEFMSKDIKILVSGSKGWEFYNYNKVIENMANVSGLYTIMNFSVPSDRDDLSWEGLEDTTLFAEFAPSPFENTLNYPVYEKILSSYIKVPSTHSQGNKMKLTKRLWGRN
ncbi:MAG: hypothetical protein BGN88_05220 [Clostridiales bacterium 43-6]|nr:MAG: hypothetical protein BGN88_05220 [Clostridiales bacterium 43-6]